MKHFVLIFSLLAAGLTASQSSFAIDLKKEFKKLVDKEKQKLEEQKKKEQEKKKEEERLKEEEKKKAAAPAAAPQPAAANPEEKMKGAWTKLPNATNGCSSGLYMNKLSPKFWEMSGRITSCFMLSLLDLQTLEKLAGAAVFSSGPHKPGAINFNSTKSFGNYNKRFVDWAVQNAIPGEKDVGFRAATYQIYVDYLQNNVEWFLATIYALEVNPEKFARLQKAYRDALASPNGVSSPEGLLSGMLKGLPQDAASPGVVGFWVRRSIDGTDGSFKLGLEKLVSTYTPDRLAAVKAKSLERPR